MFKRILFVTLIAAGMFVNASVAADQGLTVVSKFVAGDIPVSPLSSAWDMAKGVVVPMSSQIVAQPRASVLPKGKSSVRWVGTRSINNGKEIAFLLEWEDITENSTLDNTAVYRDAAALEFPIQVPKREAENPYFAMGHEGMAVNIWQWKADLEAGRDRAVPLGASYPGTGLKYYVDWYQGRLYNLPQKQRKGPVEDLNAEGFGTLTLQDSQDVMGKGLWSGGKWRVVFLRSMMAKDKDDVVFKKGMTMPLAFAIWDGGNLEKDGQKSVTTWHELKVE